MVAEQSNNFTDEQSFQWMSHVQQAIESIHQVVVYGILLVAPSGLPKVSGMFRHREAGESDLETSYEWF